MIEEVKFNFKGNYNGESMKCNACKVSDCTQSHLLECPVLIGGNELITYIPNYEDIFKGEITEQVYIAIIMKENIRRKKMLEECAILAPCAPS